MSFIIVLVGIIVVALISLFSNTVFDKGFQ